MMNTIHFTDGVSFTPSKIICVGRNYAKHIEEMKSERTASPVLFLKPNSSLCDLDKPIKIPTGWGAVHHEVELALCIGQKCSRLNEEQVMDAVAGFGLALDLTLRDLQSAAKKAGLPWAVAKGFDGACPVSTFVPKEKIPDPQKLRLSLKVNGETKQDGNTSHMLFPIPELVAYISRFFTLEPGDLILTGTPAGVGPLRPGDEIEAEIETVAKVKTKCV